MFVYSYMHFVYPVEVYDELETSGAWNLSDWA